MDVSNKQCDELSVSGILSRKMNDCIITVDKPPPFLPSSPTDLPPVSLFPLDPRKIHSIRSKMTDWLIDWWPIYLVALINEHVCEFDPCRNFKTASAIIGCLLSKYFKYFRIIIGYLCFVFVQKIKRSLIHRQSFLLQFYPPLVVPYLSPYPLLPLSQCCFSSLWEAIYVGHGCRSSIPIQCMQALLCDAVFRDIHHGGNTNVWCINNIISYKSVCAFRPGNPAIRPHMELRL